MTPTTAAGAREPHQHASHARSADPDPLVAIQVRQQVVGRMRLMNVKHAQHAWEQRYGDPLAPYGLAFLFVQGTRERADRLTVRAATKLWLAGPETQVLPRLLYQLNDLVGRRIQAGPLDVRTGLANRVDADMAPDAYYIGVGLSSLDTHTGVWEQVRRSTNNLGDVPGQIIVVLTDETTIVGQRRALSEFNAFHIHSTHSLGMLDGGAFPWNWSQPDQLRTDPAHAEVLRWIDSLNVTLWQADNARIVDGQQARSRSARGRT